MPENVVVRTFRDLHEAELFRSILEEHGIRALVGADDEEALHPAADFARGVHLYVAEADAAQASDILDQHEDDAEADADADGAT